MDSIVEDSFKSTEMIGTAPKYTSTPKPKSQAPKKSCSTYEGWDNPFRPEGELSHEAEELLQLWKEGKLKNAPPGAEVADGGAPPQANGKQKDKSALKNGSQTVDVKRETMPQASSKVQQVNLTSTEVDAKKKKGCCSIM